VQGTGPPEAVVPKGGSVRFDWGRALWLNFRLSGPAGCSYSSPQLVPSGPLSSGTGLQAWPGIRFETWHRSKTI
jgi:hypothetical protein